MEQHGDRIGFLAGRASRHPDANLFAASRRDRAADDVGNHPVLEDLERLVVAEKARHADQQILIERIQLARIAA